jgi:AbrB family looped-hinge helix DNA binding protein
MSSKGQIVLPKAVRDRLRLRPGARLEVTLNGRAIILREVGSVTRALAGLGREIWKGVDAVEYVREQRSGWDR